MMANFISPFSDVLKSDDDPNKFFLYELFDDDDAITYHIMSSSIHWMLWILLGVAVQLWSLKRQLESS